LREAGGRKRSIRQISWRELNAHWSWSTTARPAADRHARVLFLFVPWYGRRMPPRKIIHVDMDALAFQC
jgi:hypothetical protein